MSTRREATTFVIHYRSPRGDPFKVPRPHRITVGADGTAAAPYGGEIGPVTELLGFSRLVSPRFEYGADWWDASSLYTGDVLPPELAGWYACFDSPSGPFTATPKVSQVEIVGAE